MKHATKFLICISFLGAGLVAAQTAIDLAQIRNALIPVYVDAQIPIGLINGTNTTFTVAFPPNPPTSLHLYLNGLRQNAPADFTLNGVNIVFVALVPQIGDTILADYRH